MVFPSIPVYLDPPNWNQHQAAHQHGSGRDGSGGGEGEIGQLPPGLAAPLPEGGAVGAVGAMIRPGSMTDRARLAKIPQPEPGLKCPRCDSTNTKFCYFNNYSLSQPRHFCKTCRRYWTRGGALRNVPVGGGCRRNKRTKSSVGNSSKTTTTASTTQTGASSSTSTATSAGIGGAIASATHAPLPFMSSLHPLPDFAAANFGMGFAGIQQGDALDYQLGVGGGAGFENLRLQQIPQFSFLGGLDLPLPPPPPSTQVSGLYPFVGEGSSFVGQLQTKPTGSGIITQMASVKMEDSQHQQQHQQPLFNLPRQFVGVSRSDQFWNTESSGGGVGSGSGGWAPDLSGFNTSSGNII